MTTSSRIEWIDVAKAIVMMSIVIFHYAEVQYPWLRFIPIILTFFFIISGYLYRASGTILEFTKKKFLTLIVPYFAFFFLIAPFLIHDFDFAAIKLYIYGGSRLRNYILNPAFVPMWFLTSLFVTLVVYKILDTLLTEKWLHVSVVVSYILSFFLTKELPWSANLTLATIPLLHMGRIYAKYEEKISKYKIHLSVIALLSVCVCVLYPQKVIYDLFLIKYGIPIVTIAIAFGFTIFIRDISLLICKSGAVKHIFQEINKASLVILALHFPLSIVLFRCDIHIHPLPRFVIAIVLSYLVYRIFNITKATRVIFLGERI